MNAHGGRHVNQAACTTVALRLRNLARNDKNRKKVLQSRNCTRLWPQVCPAEEEAMHDPIMRRRIWTPRVDRGPQEQEGFSNFHLRRDRLLQFR